MTDSMPLSIMLTALFAVAGIGYLARAIVGSNDGVGFISDVLHVLMSVAMLTMPWGWSLMFPALPQIVVFGIATLFYLFLAMLRPVEAEAVEHHSVHHSGRRTLLFHAVMMAAMVFMAVAMSGSMTASSMSMPGMDMSSGLDLGVHMPGVAFEVACWSLVLFFALSSIWFLVRLVGLVRRVRRDRDVPSLVNTALLLLMSAGMAIGFIPA